MDSLALRLKYARKKRELTQGELAALADESQPTISKIERGEILQPAAIARLANVLGVSSAWLELGHGPTPDFEAATPPTSMLAKEPAAHYLSHAKIEHAPHVEWGENMKIEELPDVFWMSLRDNAMAPRAPAGKRVCFRRGLVAQPGDGVLVSDAAGQLHFRQYRIASAGRWLAHPLNDAHAPLDSIADKLTIVAVLMAEEGRWG